MGHLTQGDAPYGRLPWAILGRTFGAQNLGKWSRERSQVNSSPSIADTLSKEYWTDQTGRTDQVDDPADPADPADPSDPSDPSDPAAIKDS